MDPRAVGAEPPLSPAASSPHLLSSLFPSRPPTREGAEQRLRAGSLQPGRRPLGSPPTGFAGEAPPLGPVAVRPRGEQRSVPTTRGARLHDSSRGRPLCLVSRRRLAGQRKTLQEFSPLPAPLRPPRWWALKGPPPSPPSVRLQNPPRLHQPGEQVLKRPRPAVQPSCARPPAFPARPTRRETHPGSRAFPDAYCSVANRNCSGGRGRRVVTIADAAGSATGPRGRRACVPAMDRLPTLPAPGRTAPRPGLFGLAQPGASGRAADGA